jgi:hypothetical protein
MKLLSCLLSLFVLAALGLGPVSSFNNRFLRSYCNRITSSSSSSSSSTISSTALNVDPKDFSSGASSEVGNEMLPWARKLTLFLGREKETEQIYNAAEADFEQKSEERAEWSVIYASGRSGGGKSEIGRQAPHEIHSRCENGSEMQTVLGNASYLYIDMNGGGDAYDEEDDSKLKPAARMGWRIFAAVPRGSLNFEGIEELRNEIAKGKGPDVAVALRGKNFNAIADLLESTHYKLDYPLKAKDVLLALSRDLRGTTCDPHTGAAVDELNFNERVAIYVHVDEHQLSYGKGLPVGAIEGDKLDAHKAFLYDLCTLRGNDRKTWCNDNNIFLFPIFTGTASIVMAGLTAPSHFKKKVHLQLSPLSAKESQKIFLKKVKILNDANTKKKVSVDSSWTSEGSGKTSPLHFLLQELGCIPRLIILLPGNTVTMNILSQKYSAELLQQAFNSVFTDDTAALLGEEMTRVVVSGAYVDYSRLYLDGKKVTDHEFDGNIRLTGKEGGLVRLPAIDYRKSVANIAAYTGDLSSIAAFVNQEFKLKDWSDVWEEMGLDRFRNTLVVHGSLLNKDSITLEQLYPGCDISGASARIVCPTAINLSNLRAMRVCDDQFKFDSTAWTAMIRGISDGECRSVKLEKDHPTFDLIHLIRDKDVLLCFLEQYKAPSSPTRESRPNGFDGINITCTKFAPVMKEMADTVRDQGMDLLVVPVHIDRREKDNKELTQFYSKLWKEKTFEDLPIFTTVAGSAKSIPLLFPCIAHRFVLLEEEIEKEEELEEETKQRRAS